MDDSDATSARYRELIDQLQQLNMIGIALSKEKDTSELLKQILTCAIDLTNSDGGTIYSIKEGNAEFAFMCSHTLGITPDQPLSKKPQPIPLYLDDGKANDQTVVVYVALSNVTINIDDVYVGGKFDFTGSKQVDKKLNYRTKSMLTIPLCDQENTVIGVLQLINALEKDKKTIVPFSSKRQLVAESLASQAAITLTNQQLIEDQKALFEGFIKVIASAIDEKSPYTSNHCFRVPELALLIAGAVKDDCKHAYQDKHFTEEQIYELKIAAWLHDCGKVTTPEHVIDKSTKLETIIDRIDTVKQRYEHLKLQAENNALKQQLAAAGMTPNTNITEQVQQLDEELAFLEAANTGGEFMSAESQERVKMIGQQQMHYQNGAHEALLTEEEIYNLCIAKGTLTTEERLTINNHIVVTQKMLHTLPYPQYLKNVVEIAGNHHEKRDGSGYPQGLTGDELSLQARIMCIADVFEALTAADRPYKRPNTLSESINIMQKMDADGHFDTTLLNFCIEQDVFKQYAEQFLAEEQCC
ncbi:MAG: HD domain-containing protein [Methylococcales bacterium]|nr:HD domain-containing protein [Methylococcales bacterium]